MSQNPINIVTAEHVGEYRLKLSFNDGKDQVVDFSPFLSLRGAQCLGRTKALCRNQGKRGSLRCAELSPGASGDPRASRSNRDRPGPSAQ